MSNRPSRTSATIVAIGLVAVAILAPVAATAAGQLVEISSASGRKADVTRSAQLQVAEAAAHQFVRGAAFAVSNGTCGSVLVAPSTKAIVVKTVHLDPYVVAAPGQGNFIDLFVGSGTCQSFVTRANPADIGVIELTFEPGVVVPAGSALYARIFGDIVADVTAFGYKIPASAAPASVTTTNEPPPQTR